MSDNCRIFRELLPPGRGEPEPIRLPAKPDIDKVIVDLELPKSLPGQTTGDFADWLHENYSQPELRSMMDRGYFALDLYTHEDPEWDTLANLLDPFWFALEEAWQP
jgi:hypothetical protein